MRGTNEDSRSKIRNRVEQKELKRKCGVFICAPGHIRNTAWSSVYDGNGWDCENRRQRNSIWKKIITCCKGLRSACVGKIEKESVRGIVQCARHKFLLLFFLLSFSLSPYML